MAGLGDIVQLPGLSGITSAMGLKSQVRGQDVLVGALLSLAGIGAIKWAFASGPLSSFASRIPATVVRFSPAIYGGLTALALGKFVKGSKAKGYAIGAFSAGVAINALQELKTKFPVLNDVVDLRLAGLIVDDPARLNGLIVNDADRSGLNQLGALDMALGNQGSDENDLNGLMAM